MAKQLSWWNVVLASIGTWVRFPGPPMYFIFFQLTCSCAASHQKTIVHSKSCACQVSQNHNLMAIMWVPLCTPVNGSACDRLKVKQAGISMGQISQIYLLIGFRHPRVCPSLQFSSFFIFALYFFNWLFMIIVLFNP